MEVRVHTHMHAHMHPRMHARTHTHTHTHGETLFVEGELKLLYYNGNKDKEEVLTIICLVVRSGDANEDTPDVFQ